MRNLLLIIFVYLTSFTYSQEKINLNIDKKVEITETKDFNIGLGLYYKGEGIYSLAKQGVMNFSDSNSACERKMAKIEELINNEINEFSNLNNFNFQIISVERLDCLKPRVKVTFKVFNKDGTIVITKEDAKKQLLELKDYLDLGIITQEDFNNKSISLKKILLGN